MTRYQRNSAVTETEIEGETFLVEPEGEEIFYLDKVSSGLWKLLAEPRNIYELQAVFGAAFPDIDPDQIAADVAAALADLVARDLAVIVDPLPPE